MEEPRPHWLPPAPAGTGARSGATPLRGSADGPRDGDSATRAPGSPLASHGPGGAFGPPEPAAAAFGAPEPAPIGPFDAAPRHGKPRGGGNQSTLKRLFGPLVVIGLLLLKFGAKLKVLLLLLPKLKVVTTSLSMVVSVGAYAFIWGLPFAIGFVALLFVHEMGHYIQLRREGVTPSGMLFIPFLGAVVGARSLGGSAIAEARVGLAGPVLGSLASAALIPVAIVTGNQMFQALAFTGFFLNLFNLLPVVPLDGGRAMAALAPWMWLVGVAAMVVLAFTWPNPIIFLILLFALMETWRRWKSRRHGEEGNAEYYKVKPAHRAAVAAVYFGLIVLLVLGMDATFVDRSDYF